MDTIVKLPMKCRILALLSENEHLSEEEIMRALQHEYGNERQCKVSTVKTHLYSLKAVGLIEVADVVLQGGKLGISYRLTGHGRGKLPYLTQKQPERHLPDR